MKHVLIAAAIAGSVSCAMAQNFSLTLVPGATQVLSGGSFTITVYGDADVGTAYLSGAFGLSVESLNGENQVSNITWDLPLNGLIQYFDYGYGGNGTHLGTSFFQLIVPSCGMIFDCGISYGELIGSFTIQMDPGAMGDY